MKQKSRILKIASIILLAVAITSCNGLKKMAKNYDDVKYQVIPEVLETHGGQVEVTVNAEFPPKFFNKKAAIFFAPELTYDGGETILSPVLIKGEKVEGEGFEVSYETGTTIRYTETFDYMPEMKASELMVTPIAFLPKTELVKGMTIEDAKAAPKGVDLGYTKLADGVIITSQRVEMENEVRETIEIGEEVIEMDSQGNILIELYDIQFENTVELLSLAPHGYEKVTIVSENANIYFPKNLYNFNANLEWNKKTDVNAELDKLYNFVRKGWEIKDIAINGWASPEGEETFNDGLSENRAKTAQGILNRSFAKIAKEKEAKVNFKNPKEDINYQLVGHGPDWNGFLSKVESSSIKDKSPILNVVRSSNPADKEQKIREMIDIYPELEESILPPLREAKITVSCFEPKKTDQEIARLATSNPSELTQQELLYAATLTEDWEVQYKIYQAATTSYPQSWEAFNNAGMLAMKLGKIDDASDYLEKADKLSANNAMVSNNTGVLYAMQRDFTEAEKYLKKANKMGIDNNYNLGVIDITKGDYSAALSKFTGVKCNYNVALAQVLMGDNASAESNLECARKNGATYYLLAIVGARSGNEALMLTNLKKAVKAKAKYKECAVVDREFINYFDNEDFKAIVE
jgi:tetratricopeptide (TPR) repeat protein